LALLGLIVLIFIMILHKVLEILKFIKTKTM